VAGFEARTRYISSSQSGACIIIHCSFRPSLFRSRPEIGSRIRRTRSIRSAQRKFVRCLARQLLRLRWRTRLMHRRRNLRTRIARRFFPRWFGRMARRCRRNFGRFDWHRRQRRGCCEVPCDTMTLFAHDLFGKPVPTFPDHAINGSLEPAACYCVSCRSRHSRRRACRRYSLRAIRCWTDARPPPRAATVFAARP
jgi:hypothetical protein